MMSRFCSTEYKDGLCIFLPLLLGVCLIVHAEVCCAKHDEALVGITRRTLEVAEMLRDRVDAGLKRCHALAKVSGGQWRLHGQTQAACQRTNRAVLQKTKPLLRRASKVGRSSRPSSTRVRARGRRISALLMPAAVSPNGACLASASCG